MRYSVDHIAGRADTMSELPTEFYDKELRCKVTFNKETGEATAHTTVKAPSDTWYTLDRTVFKTQDAALAVQLLHQGWTPPKEKDKDVST
jgi:hypothetical protein